MLRPLRGPSALSDFTNVHTEVLDSPITPSTDSLALQRTKSFRVLLPRTDSSETDSQDRSSIYEAVPTSPAVDDEEDDAEGYVVGEWHSELSTSLENQLNDQIVPPAGIADEQQPSPSRSHSKWPLTQLETIIERCSTNTLRHSRSLPHIDLARRMTASKPFPCTGSQSLARPQSAASKRDPTRRQKAFSLDDLDCRKVSQQPTSELTLPTRSLADPEARRCSDHSISSSSSYGFCCILRNPTAPSRPVRPPPSRCKTPPGLPSFGTPQAMRYVARLSRSGQLSRHFHRRSDRSTGDSDRSHTRSLSQIHRSDSPRSTTKLKRLLGFVPAEPVISTSQPRTARVPSTILARADDGTLVRGRFGFRSGAHHASRLLQEHPFHGLAVTHQGSEGDVAPYRRQTQQNSCEVSNTASAEQARQCGSR